jgi:hypothetical protein
MKLSYQIRRYHGEILMSTCCRHPEKRSVLLTGRNEMLFRQRKREFSVWLAATSPFRLINNSWLLEELADDPNLFTAARSSLFMTLGRCSCCISSEATCYKRRDGQLSQRIIVTKTNHCVPLRIIVFRDVRPWSSVAYRCFGGKYCCHPHNSRANQASCQQRSGRQLTIEFRCRGL